MQSKAFAISDEQSETQFSTADIWKKSYPSSINWGCTIKPAPVYTLLDDAVARFPERPALYCEGTKLDYQTLGALVSKIAAGLQKIGITKGTKVGVFMPNTPYSIAFYYGILKAGATVVNYNPLYVERELEFQITNSETDYLVILDAEALLEKANNVLADTRLKGLIICPADDNLNKTRSSDNDAHIYYQDIINNDGTFEAVSIDPREDIAVLQYTGGTTGVPKGAMLTHANVHANAMQMAQWHAPIAVAGQEKILGVIPLFHVFSMSIVMNMALQLGMEIILVPKFDPEKVIALLKEKQPSFFPAVPTIYNALVSHPTAADLDLSCIKFCISGGAPLPGGIKKAFEEKTGAKLGEGYGLTEASPVLTCNPLIGEVKLGSIGLPIPSTVVEIISIKDGKTPMAIGQKGEVCAHGPQIMKGYYNNPEATADVIRNGRLHTGDVGYMDEDGYVHLVDRLKDIILVRGYNVYPSQVEEAISLNPAVEECIVAGVPDHERGETVWAWIKPKDGQELSEDSIKAFLADKLSPIEIPRKVLITTAALPKTAVGKLSRKLMLEEQGIQK
jgi:long-chain acyl-CoA synthetase